MAGGITADGHEIARRRSALLPFLACWLPFPLFECAQAEPFVFEVSVSSSSDDAEQQGGGYFSTTSSDLELGIGSKRQTVGARFANVAIPRGVLITRAYIQFQVDEVSVGPANLIIYGEASDNAATFSTDQDVFSRARTRASVSWQPVDWPAVGATGVDQRTSNVAAIIQEIVDRPGWASGRSLVLIFSGSGSRIAEAYDGNKSRSPRLHVEYSWSDQDSRLVDAGTDITVTLPDSARLSATVADGASPRPPEILTTNWSQVAGEGTATFADPGSMNTAVAFSLPGNYRLRIRTNNGEKTASDEVTVTVHPAREPPKITSIFPSSSQVAGVIKLTGRNFSRAHRVSFDDVPARFEIVSDTTIHATVPPDAPTGPLRVTNPWGSSASSEFNYIASPPVVVAAGDIATCAGMELETAALLDGIAGTILITGDLAYPSGSAEDFDNCFEPSWGRHKWRTRPVPGNHEYEVPNGKAYFDYFGPAAGNPAKGYYSFDIGTWHIVGLNSECPEVGGCDADSPQARWFREDLAENPSLCTLVYLHRPRFSSTESEFSMGDFWQIAYAAGVEIFLSSHKHNYERFMPQDGAGNPDPRGIRQFVAGTGGAELWPMNDDTLPTSEAHNGSTYGVLKLTLNPGSYDWDFLPVRGQTFTDAGSAACYPPRRSR